MIKNICTGSYRIKMLYNGKLNGAALPVIVVAVMMLLMTAVAADTVTTRVLDETNWYGADLTQFPPRVREWVINRAFTKERMERANRLNPELRAWWSDDGNTVHFEASYTVAPGRKNAGERRTWGNDAPYSQRSHLLEIPGAHAHYHTLRAQWERRRQVDEMLRTDTVFAEVAAFAKQLAGEIEYDWANYRRYTGAPVIRTPGMRYHVCDGYAREVMDKALSLNSVHTVEYWMSPGHAWNVLRLVDGRTLYLDLTWFDNEHINHETGEIYQKDDYDWENLTFDEQLFRFSNVAYGSRIFSHNAGQFRRAVSKTNFDTEILRRRHAYQSFTDKRDRRNRQTYRTIRIGNRTWMADNLNYKTKDSWCSRNADSNCVAFGRLYTWNAAMSACPRGWRLPNDADWDDLVRTANTGAPSTNSSTNNAGTNLKSTFGWSDGANGTDAFGFWGLPGGDGYECFERNGVRPRRFRSIGKYASWWSATEHSADQAKIRSVGVNFGNVRDSRSDKGAAYSVRCVME